MRRTREWENKSVILAAPAGGQVSAILLGDGTFNKGSTMIRAIVDFTLAPVTLDTTTQATIALWAGRLGGIDADISIDSPTSWI